MSGRLKGTAAEAGGTWVPLQKRATSGRRCMSERLEDAATGAGGT
jgi:hypothetical protein